MPKTLMLLEGGAYRGIFTAGALDVLLEHDFYFDAVAGISAGAMCGYHFIGRAHGRVRQILLEYGNDPRYFSTRNLVRSGKSIGDEFMFFDLMEKIPFDFKTFRESKTRFAVGATNCRTGKITYFEKGTATSSTSASWPPAACLSPARRSGSTASRISTAAWPSTPPSPSGRKTRTMTGWYWCSPVPSRRASSPSPASTGGCSRWSMAGQGAFAPAPPRATALQPAAHGDYAPGAGGEALRSGARPPLPRGARRTRSLILEEGYRLGREARRSIFPTFSGISRADETILYQSLICIAGTFVIE